MTPQASGPSGNDVAELIEWALVTATNSDNPPFGNKLREIAVALAAYLAAEPVAYLQHGIPYPPIRFPKPWRDEPQQHGLTPLYTHPAPAAGVKALTGKYGDVLMPFVAMMERELHANSGKGDRPGWLAMSRQDLLLEIHYHLAKLQKATLKDDSTGIREFGADVANMSMMLVDKCEALDQGEPK